MMTSSMRSIPWLALAMLGAAGACGGSERDAMENPSLGNFAGSAPAAGAPHSMLGGAGAAAAAGTGGAGAGSVAITAGTSASAGAGGMSAQKAGSNAEAGSGESGSSASGSGASGSGESGRSGSGGAGMSGQDAAGNGGSGGSAGSDPTTIGEGGTVDATIIVRSGETFDGDGLRYRAGSALGDGSQSEDQQPVFRLEDGAHLRNVVLGAPAADGIHTYGDVTLENIVWEDIGEDALTIKESGEVVLDGGSATNGDDKVFQINAASTFRVSNFQASNAGKFIRQNGGTTFRVDVYIDECDISNMDEAIFRTDSSSSTVTMTNTLYSNIGDELFMGVSSGNITESGNTEY